ncbi:nuclear transport factor 2 family protein [Nonomuraea guangzhouensis]|uniref:Nuclear transport factor 2 family protein n=1 Tax=Nonomuraea guangzhouensis TaxID=1291555 RepID=A0ABW4G1Y7_9ACTN|nr:nuclear transport factor 2 family protein [Nonomuraea guangzhouensis]
MTIDQQLDELGRQWMAAELSGDAEALDALAAPGFTLVGPLGFILVKDQWVSRFREGALVMHEMSWTDVTVREYGDTAVAIGVLTQRASYQGAPADGRFRVTQITVRDGDRRRLAGLHYSPIAAPPARP